MPEQLTAKQVLDLLIDEYKMFGYLCFPELRIGTGYGKDAEQRIDLWALHPFPSKDLARVAFEIKVSRNDWRTEMKKPLKKQRALLLSNEFYFVAPQGIISLDELPECAGLIEIRENRLKEYYVETVHKAPWRDGHPPTWRFVASLLRREQEKVNH